jgi:hypothetical protein
LVWFGSLASSLEKALTEIEADAGQNAAKICKNKTVFSKNNRNQVGFQISDLRF